jgi:HSP20 family protein
MEGTMANRFFAPLSPPSSWFPEPLFQLHREIDRLFEDSLGGTRSSGRNASLVSMPRIDVQEVEGGDIRVQADLPGVSPEDLDVRVDGDLLTIRGERKGESQRNEQNFHVMERSQGRFQRVLQLPFAPDPEQVRAEVREGVLEMRIPKRAAQERSRRIEVRNAGSGAQTLPTSSSSNSSSAAGSSGGGDVSDLTENASAPRSTDRPAGEMAGAGSVSGNRPAGGAGENAASASAASTAR